MDERSDHSILAIAHHKLVTLLVAERLQEAPGHQIRASIELARSARPGSPPPPGRHSGRFIGFTPDRVRPPLHNRSRRFASPPPIVCRMIRWRTAVVLRRFSSQRLAGERSGRLLPISPVIRDGRRCISRAVGPRCTVACGLSRSASSPSLACVPSQVVQYLLGRRRWRADHARTVGQARHPVWTRVQRSRLGASARHEPAATGCQPSFRVASRPLGG